MKALFTSLATTFVIQLANLANGILLARILGPVGRGELATVVLWPGLIAALLLFALDQAIVYRVASRQAPPLNTLVAALIAGAGLSLIGIVAGIVVLPLVHAQASEAVQIAGYVYLAYIPLTHAVMACLGLAQARQRYTVWNAARATLALAYPTLVAALFLADRVSITAIAVASLAAHVCALVVLVRDLRSLGLARPLALASSLRGMVRFAVPIHIGDLAIIASQRLELLVISVTLSPAVLGMFVVAQAGAGVAVTGSSTLAALVYPKVAASASMAERTRLFARYFGAALLLVAVGVAILVSFPRWLLATVFGADFAAIAGVLTVLAIAALPTAAANMLAQFFKGAGRPKIVGQGRFLGLFAKALLIAALLGPMAETGVALSVLVSEVAVVGFLLFMAWRALGLTPWRLCLAERGDVVRDVGRLLATVRFLPRR